MYSVEPPIYAKLNEVSRNRDFRFIDTLGPYAFCIFCVLSSAEYARDDKILNAQNILDDNLDQPLRNFCASFLAFRGLDLYPKELQKWIESVGLRQFPN